MKILEMGDHHPLKVLLNIHLISDASAVQHLPFILNTLSSDSFVPSPHLPKWTTRIHALLHSKGPGGRWAGLVLAQKTVALSQTLLLENAQTYVGIALPLLSKNEPFPVLKAAIRLLRTILTRLHENSDFRRQVAAANIPKLVTALIPLVEHTQETELKVVGLSTLENLILLYPTLHKAFYAAIADLALRFLNGRPHAPLPHDVLRAASRLYSIAHVTGGKVGASTLWRKTFDETLAFTTNAFWSLRTTFTTPAPAGVLTSPVEDPAVSSPLHLDRLKCGTIILDDLLSTTVYRPVQVPFGKVVQLALQLIGASDFTKKDGFVDATTHTLEVSAVVEVQKFGCLLIQSLAKRLGQHLQPYLTRMMTALALQLEQQSTSEQRYILLYTLELLLRHHPSSHSPLIATRLVKASLPSITMILARPENTSNTGLDGSIQPKSKKGKRKAQTYEADGVFSTSRPVICPMEVDGKVILTALEVLRHLLRDPHLSASMQSISVRVLISATLTLNYLPPATLSPDPTLYHEVLASLHSVSTEVVAGTSSTLSKGLPLVASILARAGSNMVSQRQLDLLLHPRLPPLVTTLPVTEHLSLVFSEESQEESDLRTSLGLFTLQEEMQQDVDTEMADPTNPPVQPPSSTTAPVPSPLSIAVPVPPPPPSPTTPSKTTPNPGLPIRAISPKFSVENPPVPTLGKSIEGPPSDPVHSTIMKSLQQKSPKSAPRPPQAENSGSSSETPVYDTLNPMAGDEDEDMPAIDMDSDSDIE